MGRLGAPSIESGSLAYPGFGAIGENRVQLGGSITVSREFALDPGDLWRIYTGQ
ncbi:MAG: hypothetical protein R3C45_12580 [Phycisphaerales bacterium]